MKSLAIIAAMLFALVSPTLAQTAPDLSKFYVYVPIEAEGHKGPMFYTLKPFDDDATCKAFAKDGWRTDAEFKSNIGKWVEMESDAHEGKVNFGNFFCASPGSYHDKAPDQGA